MFIEEIENTAIWELYSKGRNYHRMTNVYDDTDKNYRFYNGDQWSGAKLGNCEKVQKNFIKPIVKYKQAIIHDNLYAIVFSSQNYESREKHSEYARYCTILNAYASKVWEKEKMDFKGRRLTKDAAINDEGIMYIDFDTEAKMPICEIVKKNDIYYGNENDDNIQNQPYILIRKRMPVSNAVDFALGYGCKKEDTRFITGDNDNYEESGDAAKQELDGMVTIVYKLYKKNGIVHFSIATKYVDICKDVSLDIKRYPVAHMNWEEKEGSARGEGEVRYHIPTQIEVNKIEMRRIVTVHQQAYPRTVVNTSKITNPSAINTVGGIIKTNGQAVDDVNKIIATLQPAQMSSDVKILQDDLINITRELAGAGDSATGNINPESASGRAILAVQQASQAPMTEQRESYKNFLEDVAHIWLEYLIAHSSDGIPMEETITEENGEEYVQLVTVPKSVLRDLQVTIKIDVTPKSVYDRYAQESILENLLTNGFLHIKRIDELEAFLNALDDDTLVPKQALLDFVKRSREKQQKIAALEAKAMEMQMRAEQFLYEDADSQAQMLADAAPYSLQNATA